MALTFPTDAHVGNVKNSYSGAMLCSMGTSYAEAETWWGLSSIKEGQREILQIHFESNRTVVVQH